MSDRNVNGSSVTISSRQDTELVVSEKATYKENYFPFSMMGPLHREERKMDLIDRLHSVSRGAFGIFRDIKNRSTEDYNFATLKELAELTDNQKRAFRSGIAELRKMELVVRAKNRDPQVVVPKNTYMMNPYYIKCWKYTKAKELWSLYNQ